jgi:hypothetical protein
MSKAAALRQAQIDTQAQPGYEDPFYWAGFVLSGDGGEVNEAETALMPATSSPVVVQEVAEVQEIEPEKTPAWVWWGLISLVLLTGSGGVVFWWFRRGRA